LLHIILKIIQKKKTEETLFFFLCVYEMSV